MNIRLYYFELFDRKMFNPFPRDHFSTFLKLYFRVLFASRENVNVFTHTFPQGKLDA